MSIDANRGFVAWRHDHEGAPGNPYRDVTLGWYGLHWELLTPRWAFDRADPDFTRAVGELLRRDRLGEPLGGEVTPV